MSERIPLEVVDRTCDSVMLAVSDAAKSSLTAARVGGHPRPGHADGALLVGWRDTPDAAAKSERVWAEVRRNEDRFFRYQLRKGFNPVTWVMTRLQRWRSVRKAEMRHKRVIAHERLLAVELALRCYEYEQGHAPAGLDQLVPNYIQHVPPDPFTGRPVIYRPQGTDWLVYSVGEDGSDDGGKRVGRSVSGAVTRGDLFYDSPY